MAPDWDGIFADYGARQLTVMEICRRYGVSRGQLYRKAKELNLELRRPRNERPCSAVALRQLLDSRIQLLMASGTARIDPMAAAELDREAKAVCQLARAIEAVEQLEAKPGEQGAGQADDEHDPAWREALARKLEGWTAAAGTE